MFESAKGRTAILIGLLVAAAVPAWWIAYYTHGWMGILSASAAWTTCLVSGLLALMLVQLFNSPDQVMHQVVLGMGPRMGIPLAVCMLVYFQGGGLADAGFVYYLLVFYLITLAVETLLLVGGSQNRPRETTTG